MLTVTILLDSVEKVQRFVSKISRYSCGFDVECGNSCVDGKSLVGLFSLDISRPLQLTVNGGESEIEDVNFLDWNGERIEEDTKYINCNDVISVFNGLWKSC